MRYLFFLVSVLLTVSCFSQTNTPTVLSNSGNSSQNGNLHNSFTVGEISVTTSTNSSNILTQGFHQPATTLRIEEQPISQEYCEWDSATISVQMAGGGTFSFQWYKDQTEISGETNKDLIFPSVLQADAGQYYCSITNQFGQIFTDTVSLIIYQVPTSPFSVYEPGCINTLHSIEYTGNATGNANYSWYIQEIDTNLIGSGPHTLEWSALGNKTIQLHVDEDNCYSDTSSYTLNIRSLPAVTLHPSNYIICEGFPAEFQGSAIGDGVIQQWQANMGIGWTDLVDDTLYSGVNTGILQLSTTYVDMDSYQYRLFASGTCPPNVNTANATITVKGKPRVTYQPVDQEGCENQTVSFVATTTGTNLEYQWYQSPNGVMYSPVFGATTNDLSMSILPSMNGYSFFCEIWGDCGQTIFTDTVLLTVKDPPVISSVAENIVSCSEDTIILSIDASGENLTFQWEIYQFNDWYPVAGAEYSGINTDSLQINGVAPLMDGISYRCKVFGDCSSGVNSYPKTLTVNTTAVLLAQPVDQEICVDESVTFTVQTEGSNINFQWFEKAGVGWAQLAGETDQSLTIAMADGNMNGKEFYCKIEGDCGSILYSDTVLLIVNDPVMILLHPSSQGICVGDEYELNVFATGTQPVTYQWQLDFSDITSADSTSYTIQDASPSNAGYYTCVITNICGDEMTNAASVDINDNPDVSISAIGETILCLSESVNLSAPAGYSYFWNTGSALQTINVDESGEYYVIASNQFGCSDTSNSINVMVSSPYNEQEICLVTVNIDAGGKNAIIWEKPVSNSIVSFNIHKEVATNIYNWLGNIAYQDESVFIDYSSAPESHGDKYKLTILDTCGNESDYSYFHKTMNLGLSNFGNTMYLDWDDYEEESGSFVPAQYYIYKGTSPASMFLHDSVSGSFTSYNDVGVYDVYFYMVGVVKETPCNTGSKALYSSAFSNQKDNEDLITALRELDPNFGRLKIYPNPFSDKTTIEFDNSNNNFEFLRLTDITGKEIRRYEDVSSGKVVIERGDLASGVYIIEVNGTETLRSRIVVQ